MTAARVGGRGVPGAQPGVPTAPPAAGPEDPALPELDVLVHRPWLAALLDRLPWLDDPDGAAAAVRLRWKPGTNVRLGAVVPTAHGPAAVLVASFGPGRKADALAAHARRLDLPAYRAGSLVAVPARADPNLAPLVPADPALAYNPARRWVGRAGGWALKVHAVAPPADVTNLVTNPPPGLAVHLPAAHADHGGRVLRSAWVPGDLRGSRGDRAAAPVQHATVEPDGARGDPADGPSDLPADDAADLPADHAAVRAAVAALHATPVPAGLPVLDEVAILPAAQAAAHAVAATLPAERDRLAALVHALQQACTAGRWPPAGTLVHGDLSPDQVVVACGRAILLDLDRAARGPAGWDGATWEVAQLAAAPPTAPAAAAPGPTGPILVLAAALLRAPEPFRRLRPGWPRLTSQLLDRAEGAARDLAPAPPHPAGTASRPAATGAPPPPPATRTAPALRALRRLPTSLQVRRAWPHRDGLAVETRTAHGTVLAALVTDDRTRLLAGADSALPALAPALREPGAVLLGHRPGRRAVLRRADGRYVKVVRPGRTGAVVDGLRRAPRHLAGLPDAPIVPAVHAHDPAAGQVVLDPVPGPSLHELLRDDPAAATELTAWIGAALGALATIPVAGLPRHDADAEARVLRRWLDDADGWAGTDLADHADAALPRLAALPEPAWTACHRDLHDKQVLAVAGPDRAVGLLDLDTLCAADPAVDAANLLAHLHLRHLQGHCTTDTARRCATALHAAAGVAALPPAAVAAYTAATLLRLAAVYTFRPARPHLVRRLAILAATPDPWRIP
ncbi:hypothetical protein [Pseudonocardia sp.]|uniref:hypothetical protein n=1 Tax=Pseudonocardia sp. TaxID=60912 RepID=UPI003D0F596C